MPSSSCSPSSPSSSSARHALNHPARTLILAFAAWKLFLLLVALASPGNGYDTSTSLALHAPGHHEHRQSAHHAAIHTTVHAGPLPPALHHLAVKLTRWDAIYYTKAAERGYRFEQEWAFGWGLTRLIALITSVAHKAGIPAYAGLESIVGIALAHVSHLLSALTLLALSRAVFPHAATSAFPLVAALLHILSPGALFLSAPYAESPCALLSFLGCLLFTRSRPLSGGTSTGHDILLVAAGVVFGAAATLRSNAILNGLLLLEEAFRALFALMDGLGVPKVRRLLAAGLGGLCVGVGFLLPQYIAYIEYCTPSGVQPREWCAWTLPSIYTFVQEHYWNCGPFRYWTLSNLPLFLLAAPMLSIMTVSGFWALFPAPARASVKNKTSSPAHDTTASIVRNLAVSQLLLTLLTLVTAHVQIITRISSACPVWVWFLARPAGDGASPRLARLALTVMLLYGIIQGALFASFLPPA